MDFTTRRSIRKYKDTPVEKEKVDEILKAALLAPTGRNSRPCEFVVIDDKELIKEVGELKEGGASFVKDAPLVIGVLGEKGKSNTLLEDCSIAAFAIQVKAHELGLGTCWVHALEKTTATGESSEEYFLEKVGAPKKFTVMCLITVGYSDEVKPVYTEKDINLDKVSYNKYGNRR